MACAITTNWANVLKWTNPNQKDISHYEVYRRTDAVTASITTADVVAKIYHITNTEAPYPYFADIFTALNTKTAYWYWVKSVDYSGLRSTGDHPTITADRTELTDIPDGALTLEPTGFPNRTDSVLSWDNGTRTLSISPSATSFTYYVKGQCFTVTAAQTLVPTETTGQTWFAYNSATLTEYLNPVHTTIETLIKARALVAMVYWNTAQATKVLFGDERHGMTMDGETHHYLHEAEGLRYGEGLALVNFTADQTGADNVDAQFGHNSGLLYDEDIQHTAAAVASTTGLPIFYRSGAGGPWVSTTNAGYSVITAAAGTRLTWNQNVAGTWQLTEVANNQFVLCHVIATNQSDYPLIAMVGQSDYTTLAAAQTGATTEINSILLGDLPGAEIRPIGTIIFQTANGYGNQVNARVRSVAGGGDYIDWRTATIGGSGVAVSDHGSLSGLGDDDHTQYVINDGSRGAQSICAGLTIGGDVVVCGSLTTATLNVTAAASVQTTLHVSGAVTFGDSLTVSGITTINNSLTVSSLNVTASASVQTTLHVSGAVTFGDALTVSGITTINNTLTVSTLNVTGSASVQNTLHVSGAVTFGSTLSVSGISSFNNNVGITGALTVDGVTVINDALTVSGASTLQGATTISGGLTVNTLSVTGAASVGSTLHVSGAVTFGNTLSVSGQATFSNNVRVSGNFSVSGTSSFDGNMKINAQLDVSAQSSFGIVSISGAFTVDAATTINNSLTVSTLNVTSSASIQTTLHVSGAVTFGSTLAVSSTATFGGTVTTCGDLTVCGTLTIQGTAITNDSGINVVFNQSAISSTDVDFNTANFTVTTGTGTCATVSLADSLSIGSLTLSTALTVCGTTTLVGNVSVSGTLHVSNSVTFGDALTVSGVSSFNNNVGITGSLTVDGATIINDALTVSGTSTLQGATTISGGLTVNTLSVTGAASVGSTLHVSGAVTFGSTLAVSSTATFGGTVTTCGDLTVCGTLTIQGTAITNASELNVVFNQSAISSTDIDFSTAVFTVTTGTGTCATVSLANSINIGSLTLSSSLTVCGITTLVGNVSISGTLHVSNAVTFGSTLSVSNQATFSSNVVISGTLTMRSPFGQISATDAYFTNVNISTALTVSASIVCYGVLDVVASATFTQSVAIRDNLSVTDYFSVGALVTPNSTNIAEIGYTETDPANGHTGLYVRMIHDPAITSTNTKNFIGIDGFTVLGDTNCASNYFGLRFGPYTITVDGGDTAFTSTYGIYTWGARGFGVTFRAADSYGVYVKPIVNDFGNSFQIGTLYGIYISDADAPTAGNITTYYQQYIEKPTRGTTNYQLVLNGNGTASTGMWLNGTSGVNLCVNSSNHFHATWTLPTTTATTYDLYWDGTSKKIYYRASSRRYKDNIEDFNDDWHKILQVQPKTFTMKGGNEYGIGYIAEEIEEIGLNHLVSYNKDGQPEALDYKMFSLYAIEIIKEQDKKINDMEHRLSLLESICDKG